ncbi:hypothetical protein BMF94_0709 [Rhodotorula taiwanensis]|uniref:VTT domain-containing protein n=1 Tax=Rhodotorula taiwanensis TaxID=741276 RepID=A0A2S5BHD3_9BASI|nr:hypothetical protein BMF94_0709 [Rhodotorula taiwanensis]
MSRSRSSTVSSAYRSPVPSTDQPLHSDHVAGSSSSSSPPPSTTTMMGPRSYASEHSLHTLRGPKYMIDLPTTRSRSDTFGGVELPSDAQLRRDDDRSDSDGDDDDDDKRAGTPLTRQRTSSVSSLRSLDPALHLGGAPLKERRPVLYAGLQAGALLLASILGLYLTLKLALPPIDPEHKDKVKLPKSFDDLKELNEVLQVYSERNYYRVMGCWVAVYLFLQAFSVPGSMYLSILGGALWGVLIALPLVCFSVATGALLCYFLSAALGPAVLSHSEVWQRRIDRWAERIKEHDQNLISYLIVLRIAPLPPHWVVNIAAYHVGISPWKFWLSTFLGIAGVSYIHTTIGTTLDQMTSSADFHLISWQNGLGLGGIIVAVLIPVALRRAFAADIADAADDAQEEPTEPLLHPRTSLSLDSDAARPGTQRHLLDGTARSSTDGSARVSDLEAGRPSAGNGSADKASRVLGVRVR